MLVIIQIICAIIPLFLIRLFIRERIEYRRLLKIIFYMEVSTIGIVILGMVKTKLEQKGFLVDNFLFISILLSKLLYNALPEEIFKFLAIKKMKPQNQATLIKDTFLTSTVFMCIENIAFSRGNFNLMLFRMFIPIHLLAQLVMVYFMLKNYNEKDNKKSNIRNSILGLTLPILIHTLYNTFVTIMQNVGNYVVIALGILTYLFVFMFIRKELKKYNTYNQEEGSNIKISKFNIIFIVLFTLFWIYIYR